MPISKIDAEIWSELIILIGRDGNQVLYDIVSKYKFLADRDIHEDLLAYNTVKQEINTSEDDGETPEYVKALMIKIKDVVINANFILKLSFSERYCEKAEGMIYELIINEDLKEKMDFANTTIPFGSHKARELEMERITEQLTEYGYKFLID